MNAEFNWWLLIVGLVAGGGLVWLVLADWGRHDDAASQRELEAESAWIAEAMQDRGEAVDPRLAEDLLLLHRTWVASTHPRDDDWPPPDDDPNAAVATMAPPAPNGQPDATAGADQTDAEWLTNAGASSSDSPDQPAMDDDDLRGLAAPSIRVDPRARLAGDGGTDPTNTPAAESPAPHDPDAAAPGA